MRRNVLGSVGVLCPPFSQGGVLCSDEALTINVLYTPAYIFVVPTRYAPQNTIFMKSSEDGLGRGREDWLPVSLLISVGRDILNCIVAVPTAPLIALWYQLHSVRSFMPLTAVHSFGMLLDMHAKTRFSKKGLTSSEDSAIMVYGRCFVAEDHPPQN